MNDGWELEGTRTAGRMRMTLAVTPPPWRVAVEFINPIAWLFGPTWPLVTRTLTVSSDPPVDCTDGTTGYVPHQWTHSRKWEVPDGPVDGQDAPPRRYRAANSWVSLAPRGDSFPRMRRTSSANCGITAASSSKAFSSWSTAWGDRRST